MLDIDRNANTQIHTIGSFYFFALMIFHDIPMDMHMVFILLTLPLEWSGENNFISLPKKRS